LPRDAGKDEVSFGRELWRFAFVKGKEVAYKAVMRPVEGTILTVIRESSAASMKR
jgi:dihydroxyacetone kinase-like predicted kinase